VKDRVEIMRRELMGPHAYLTRSFVFEDAANRAVDLLLINVGKRTDSACMAARR